MGTTTKTKLLAPGVYDNSYFIRVAWGPRREPAHQCAQRTGNFLRDLGRLDHVFSNWRVAVVGKHSSDQLPFIALGPAPAPLVFKEIKKWLLKGRSWTDRFPGGPPRKIMRDLGYSASFYATRGDCSVGCGRFTRWVHNDVMINLPITGEAGRRIRQLPKLTQIVKAAVKRWDPDTVVVTSHACCRKLDVRAGWITYVSDEFAKGLSIPHLALMRRFGKGRLIYASRHRFSADNPKHLHAVKELSDAIQRLQDANGYPRGPWSNMPPSPPT